MSVSDLREQRPQLARPTGRLSISTHNAILQFSRATGRDRLALLILADFSDDEGYVPGISVARMRELLGLKSERGTQKALARLVAAGELDKGRGLGMRGTNSYLICAVAWARAGATPEPQFRVNPSSGVNARTQTGELEFAEGVNCGSPKELESENPEEKRDARAGANAGPGGQPSPAKPSQEIAKLWQVVLDKIESQTNRVSFHTWFRPLSPVALRGSTLTIEVPNEIFVDWHKDHGTQQRIVECLNEAGIQVRKVDLIERSA